MATIGWFRTRSPVPPKEPGVAEAEIPPSDASSQ